MNDPRKVIMTSSQANNGCVACTGRIGYARNNPSRLNPVARTNMVVLTTDRSFAKPPANRRLHG